ncbi:alpha-glucosidase family protein [Arvimicrobium flavum]|uniref:beta-galactosidase BglA n=1 Tax=Arvimicrobium flavum TaxID=3393320 RepID=UPI00237BDED8|nr:alpha-glucosidase family protein [Mesorhizobium shangrilense]
MSERAESEWWRGCVIYQVYPRSYQDTTGDGVGDLKGVTRRLPHIASLSVDAVWLSPFCRSPMADMGYDVSDYLDVDSMFGTLADFDALLAEAHRLGLKVIMDLVVSHSSDRHPWFVESRASRDNPKADWYVWADARPDGTAPTNWLSVFGGPAWEWDSTRRQYYQHNFLAAQPDLNFHNPDVREALLDAARFWLERGVDGFRLDTVNYYFHDLWLRDNPPTDSRVAGLALDTNPYLYQWHLFDKSRPENLAFLKDFRDLLNQYPNRTSVGEVGDEGRSLETVAAYTGGGERLHMCYTFDLLGPDFSPAHIRGCVEASEDKVADGWICWAFSNHDVMRHVSRFAKDGQDPEDVAKLAIAVLAALRGSICLYQGEELGLEEAELTFEQLRDPYGIRFWPGFKGRDGCRTPMPWSAAEPNAGFSTGASWLPVPEAHRAKAVDTQTGPSSVLNRYREALAFRAAHPALVGGSIRFLEADEHVLSFVRTLNGESILCLFNFSDEEAVWPFPSDLGALEALDFPTGAAEVSSPAVALPPLGALFARIEL